MHPAEFVSFLLVVPLGWVIAVVFRSTADSAVVRLDGVFMVTLGDLFMVSYRRQGLEAAKVKAANIIRALEVRSDAVARILSQEDRYVFLIYCCLALDGLIWARAKGASTFPFGLLSATSEEYIYGRIRAATRRHFISSGVHPRIHRWVRCMTRWDARARGREEGNRGSNFRRECFSVRESISDGGPQFHFTRALQRQHAPPTQK